MESPGRRFILDSIEEAKKIVDSAYKYSRDEWVNFAENLLSIPSWQSVIKYLLLPPKFQEFSEGTQGSDQTIRQTAFAETAGPKNTRGCASRGLHGTNPEVDQWESSSRPQKIHQCYKYEDNTFHWSLNSSVYCSTLTIINMLLFL